MNTEGSNIYTITFNPSIDYMVTVEDLQIGEVNRAKEEVMFPGGKGINVSLVLKNLGYDSKALGFIAGFTGDKIQAMLRERGIATDFIQVEQGMSRINVNIKTNQDTQINGIGPCVNKNHMDKLWEQLDALESGDTLVLAGSTPACVSSSVYMDIMKKLQGRQIRIVVDATKDLLRNVLQYRPFLIKPNHHELGELFDVELKTRGEVIPYAKRLIEMGSQNVLVSMAGEGAVLVTGDGQVYELEAPKGTVKNSVGAGDSMVAGFLAGYMETGSYECAFRMGVCTGSASAFSEGMATKEQVEQLMASL